MPRPVNYDDIECRVLQNIANRPSLWQLVFNTANIIQHSLEAAKSPGKALIWNIFVNLKYVYVATVQLSPLCAYCVIINCAAVIILGMGSANERRRRLSLTEPIPRMDTVCYDQI